MRHGIYNSEVPTSVKPAVSTSNLPVIFGTSPINLAMPTVAGELPKVNTPVLCYTLKEAYESLGYCKDYKNFTLTEAVDIFFKLYGMAPVCFINILDPVKHKKSVQPKVVTLVKDSYIEEVFGILKHTVKVKSEDGTTSYVSGTDFLADFTTEGYLKIVKIGIGIGIASTKVKIEYDVLDSSMVTESEIIGGYDITTGQTTGLELTEQVFPKFRIVPTMLLCPKYGESSAVAAILDTKADKINVVFECMSIVDISETVTTYTAVPEWKNQKNLLNDNQIVCWPKVTLGDDVYHMSLHVAALMCSVDYKNGDHPKESPSNKAFKSDGTCIIKDGVKVPILLTLEQANYLNANGILTSINFINGWTAWGNRTSCYPANTDAKDAFISAKRVFHYYANNFVLTHWIDVDKPTNPRLINLIVDSRNEFYNGEVGAEKIIAGKVAFLKEENSITDLLDGGIKFHHYITPALPAEKIENIQELDINGYNKLFK